MPDFKARFFGRHQLWIAVWDGGANDHNRLAILALQQCFDRRSGLFSKNINPLFTQLLNGGVVPWIRSTDWMVSIRQNFCERRHADPPNSDEMDWLSAVER